MNKYKSIFTKTFAILSLIIIFSFLSSFASASIEKKNLKLRYNPETSTYSYINKDGKTIIPLDKNIMEAKEFSEGLAVLRLDNYKYGAIDETGQFVIKPIYDKLWQTTEGLTAYIITNRDETRDFGYLDKKGNIALKRTHEEELIVEEDLYNPEFSQGLAVAYDSKSISYGYINRHGEFVIKPKFDTAKPFRENLAAVSIDAGEKYGYIDIYGKMSVPAKYEDADSFSEGLAAIYSKGKWGYIDKTGKEVIKPIYYSIEPESFKEESVEVDYNYASEFSNNSAPVCIKQKKEKGFTPCCSSYALINKSGKIISDKSFDKIVRVDNTYVVTINKNNKSYVGLIDSKGNWIKKPVAVNPF